ncbi:MAG: DNA primase [Puniceicoccales bacterium]|jgi:DNA primase|nr:DNA primase [Puniceicoccales bacterium]
MAIGERPWQDKIYLAAGTASPFFHPVGRIREESIAALREKADLCDVASAYVQLRRAGAYFRGLSPFNEERTPSFFIHPERRWFHCYSSGHAGDVFRLVELKEQLSFREAVEFLAEKYNFSLEYESGGPGDGDGISKNTLFAVHDRAGRIFQENFFAPTAEGHAARCYWMEVRHFSLDAAERHGIGLASEDSQKFCSELGKIFGENALVAAGLCFSQQEGSTDAPHHHHHGCRCRFRNRITIPIRDLQDRIVAFAGRILPGDGQTAAKYINSPETAIFRKSSLLFGLSQARKALVADSPFFLTEGPLDCLRCWECGLKTAIAVQGTAITHSHLAMLRRHSPRLDCLLDGDVAGERAALRLIPLALEVGLELQLLRLPQGMDPDQFFFQKGRNGLDELPRQDVVEFLTTFHLSGAAVGRSAVGRRDGLRRILETIAAAKSPALERELLHQVSLKAAVPLDVLLQEYGSPAGKPEKLPQATAHLLAGDGLLAIYARCPHRRSYLAEQILPEWLGSDRPSERILNRLMGELLNGVSWDRALEDLSEEDRCHVLHLAASAPTVDEPATILELLRSVHESYLRREMGQLLGRLDDDAIGRRRELQKALRMPPSFTPPGEP